MKTTVVSRTFTSIAAAVAAAAFLVPTRSEACRCMAPAPVRESVKKADAVFLGKAGAATGTTQRTTQFKVKRYWKGDLGRSEKVTTNASPAACGVQFARGDSYLVYATRREGGGFSTSSCTRTKPAAGAREEIAQLGRGKVPTETPPAHAVAGTWNAKARWKIELEFKNDGSFEKRDLVSPCPPNARCIWSGIVFNRGGYKVVANRVLLTYKTRDTKMGVTLPKTLKIVAQKLVEQLPGGKTLTYTRARTSSGSGGGSGVRCGNATCPAGQVCCNASCGICTPPGGACIQMACGPTSPTPAPTVPKLQ